MDVIYFFKSIWKKKNKKKPTYVHILKLWREIGQTFEESQGGEVVNNLTERYK